MTSSTVYPVDFECNAFSVYGSQRSGEIRVLSFKVVITLMCRGHLEEKYRCKCVFRFLAFPLSYSVLQLLGGKEQVLCKLWKA